MEAKHLYAAGKLSDAIAAALTVVKSKPLDAGARLFLSELICFQGDWDRAEKQLDSVVKQGGEASLLALLMRQLIRGEILREQAFTEGRSPQFVGPVPQNLVLQLEMCAAIRVNDSEEATRLVALSEAARAACPGESELGPFSDIRDLDDRVAGALEVITATGRYYWVPWPAVRTLEFCKPERPLDLIWRKVLIDVENGPEGEVFVPVRYPLVTAPGWDDQLRLARSTAWEGEEHGPVTGLGQRMLLVGDEVKTILELNHLKFAQ